jgi:hypothetical protein
LSIVQCQRSPNSTILTAAHMTAPGTWTCPGDPYAPGCSGGEVYFFLDDPEWRRRFDECVRLCESEFGSSLNPDVETVFFVGEEPESVFEAHAGYHSIYFQRDSDIYQMNYQLGQEVFHRVCTPSGTNHWAHEMLSLLFSFDYLDSVGFGDYRKRQAAKLRAESQQLSITGMMEVSAMPYPEGMYGRAFVTGERLRDEIGWSLLKPLARMFDSGGKPDVVAWKRSLSDEAQAAIAWLPV